jgi:hypothetical protein
MAVTRADITFQLHWRHQSETLSAYYVISLTKGDFNYESKVH